MYARGGNANQYHHRRKQKFFRKLKSLEFYEANLLDVYLKEMKPECKRRSFTPMFIAALFSVAEL